MPGRVCALVKKEKRRVKEINRDKRPVLTIAAGLHGFVVSEGCLGLSCK